MPPRLMSNGSSGTTGYLILSALSIMSYALFMKDALLIVFAIPVILVFVLAASIDSKRGTPDEDLAAVGFSNKNLSNSIPLGLLGGVLALIIGSLIIKFNPSTASAIIPDFSAGASLVSGSVIPSSIGQAVNIASQWLIVSVSEETGFRILAIYAFYAAFKNQLIAIIAGSGLWILTHVPTFSANNVPNQMYLVLAALSIIFIGLLYITGNVITSIIAHSVFNTGVLIASSEANQMTYGLLILIAIVLAFAYFSGNGSKRGTRV